MKKTLCRTAGVLLVLVLILLAAVLGYVAYVFIAYHRIGDMPLVPETARRDAPEPTAGEEYTLFSWNIGFGAYTADFGFFMDGGEESWARSREDLDGNLGRIAGILASADADFVLLQEVDTDSTRTYHVDERAVLTGEGGLPLSRWDAVYAPNYDSPFLFYPFTEPHGASKSGLLTFSKARIASAARVELPVEGGVRKFLDLDRCYSVSRIPVRDGGELVLYNFHLSAYTSDGTVSDDQLKLLIADMQKEYEAGNRCIAGGDFNKDLPGNSAEIWVSADREHTWAQPLPEGIFDGSAVSPVVPFDEENPVPSCRNADSAYHPGQFVVTVDGFLVTDNVRVLEARVIDDAFRSSDHNPVVLRFSLD